MANLFDSDQFYFTVRMYKKMSTNPQIVWANTYELFKKSNAVMTADEYQLLVTTLLGFESSFHAQDVLFDRAVVSTFVEDGEPYNPESFITFPLLDTAGERSAAFGEFEPLNLVLFVRRSVPFGRNGKLYYRRVVLEDEVASPAGVARLVTGAAIYTLFANSFSTYLTGLTTGEDNLWALVMAATGQTPRNITNLSVSGVRVVKFNNRYFDKA